MSENRPLHFNYGELANNPELVDTCESLADSLKGLQEVLDDLLPLKEQYATFTPEAQIELDLFLLYALNSLHWIHLRIMGVDTMSHPVTAEVDRIKATMLRWQQVKDRSKRPTVNLDAAKRFVRSGLYDPSKPNAQQNKKTKF